jgi:hypothetical protein
VGIGVTPTAKLDVNGTVYIRTGGILYVDSLRGYTSGTLSTTLSQLALSSSFGITGGNVLIGTTTDSGYKLDVNGTGRFSGQLDATILNISSGTNAIATINSTYVGGGFLQMKASGTVYGYVGCSSSILAGTTNDFAIVSRIGTLELGANSARGLIFSTTNAATFSSSVTLSATDSRLLGGNATASGRLVVSNSDTSSYLTLNGPGNTTPHQVVLGVNSINAITLASTGAATFSNTISSGGTINSGDSITMIGELYYGGVSSNRKLRAYSSGSEGSATLNYSFWTGSAWFIRSTLDSNGAATFVSSVTATSFFESSSIKGKDIIATNPLLALDIDVIKYTRKSDESKDIRYGYSAEQIHSLMPELTDKDVTAVKYLDVHTILIANLQKEIRELKAKINN